jgi:RNA polymerase sigma-70 factor (ECF subfamily)
MNFSGHENPGACHVKSEEERVDAPVPTPTDQDIVTALGRGRDAAAELLVAEHATAIGRLCHALLGSQSEAEDALQETLVAALDGLGQFRGEGSLRAWLSSIARRRCARQLTARSREQDAHHALSQVASESATPPSERSALARRARTLLAEIKPTEREALVLRFAGELSFREVGQACDIDEAAARKRVSRGLGRLRALMGEDES